MFAAWIRQLRFIFQGLVDQPLDQLGDVRHLTSLIKDLSRSFSKFSSA
jgi:hypothetical protein